MRRILLAFVFAFAFVASASAAITPDLQASRTTCVAPCYVHFDATATRSTTEDTAPKAFRNLYYRFDFDDPGAGTWARGNQFMNDKNEERGAGGIAAHVFETAGTYTVTVTVYDINGDSASDTVEITVSAQADTASLTGSNVICVSTDGIFTGAPASCTQVTTSDISTAFSNLSSTKKRITFKRGNTWTDTGLTTLTVAGRVVVDAWGSGDKPILSGSNASGVIAFGDGISDYSLQDLDVRGTSNYGILNAGDWSKILFLRLDMSGSDGLLSNEFSGGEVHSEIAFVDGTITVTNYTAYFASTKPAMLGSRFETTGTFTQNWRTHAFIKGIWAHNEVYGGSDSNSDMVKFGAPEDVGGPAHWVGLYTELSIIRDSIIDDSAKDDSEGGFVTGPEGTGAGEEVRYLVFERNKVIVGSSMATAIRFDNTVDCRIQNNLIILTGGAAAGFSLAIGIYDREAPTPAGNEVYNNTVYRADNGGSFVSAVWVSTGGGTTHAIKNNLAYNPVGSGQDAVQDNPGGSAQSNNSSDAQMAGTNPGPSWAASTDAEDFQITSGSYANGAGADNLKVFDDYFGNIRAYYGTPNTDIGFHALNTSVLPDTDATAPVLSSPGAGTPSSTGTVNAVVTTDEGNGTLYWAVVTNGGSATDAQLKAGTGGNIVVANSQAVSTTGVQTVASIAGLSIGTLYQIKFLQSDAAANDSSQASVNLITRGCASTSTCVGIRLSEADNDDIFQLARLENTR